MKTTFYFDTVITSLGPLTVVVNGDGAVTELYTSDRIDLYAADPSYCRDGKAVSGPRTQLEEYACGDRRTFELDLAPKGSPFQRQVWEQLLLIPYGETRSYGQLAQLLGNPKASRAVGRANATNPISIIVPCHRVIGLQGDLTGYAGGLPFKRKLLELEGVLRPNLFELVSDEEIIS